MINTILESSYKRLQKQEKFWALNFYPFSKTVSFLVPFVFIKIFWDCRVSLIPLERLLLQRFHLEVVKSLTIHHLHHVLDIIEAIQIFIVTG